MGKKTKHPSDPLGLYLHEISEVPLLNKAQEVELARRIKLGDKAAREHLIRANLRLVVSVARIFTRPKKITLADFISAGNEGLIIAVEKFNPQEFKNVRFSTYATYWIKQSIRRYLQDHGQDVRIPNYLQDKIRTLDYNAAVPIEKQKPIKVTKRHEYNITRAKHVSKTSAITDETPLPAEKLSTLKHVHQQELKDLIHDYLIGADPIDRLVLEHRYLNENTKTLAEVGKILGLTRERIRQIEATALYRISQELHLEEYWEGRLPLNVRRDRNFSTKHVMSIFSERRKGVSCTQKANGSPQATKFNRKATESIRKLVNRWFWTMIGQLILSRMLLQYLLEGFDDF